MENFYVRLDEVIAALIQSDSVEETLKVREKKKKQRKRYIEILKMNWQRREHTDE